MLVLSLVQPLELTLVRVIMGFWIVLVTLLPLRGIGGPRAVVLTQAISYDWRCALLLLLVMINTWSCLISRLCMTPHKDGWLRGLLLSLTTVSILFFSETSFLKFYIYFEFSLIPIFLIIMGWGYQIERVGAAKAMILYTMMRSLPLLILILATSALGHDSLGTIVFNHVDFRTHTIFTYLAFSAFLVKLPIFFFHMWLPKAHVEAPVIGSIFLAAILLKLGGFGLIKIKIFIAGTGEILIVLRSISLWGLVFIRIVCCHSTDIKVLIAFSSVAHISFVVITLIRQSNFSFNCALLVIVAHGLSSSAAFFFRFLLYKTSQTRRILLNKSLRARRGLRLLFWGLICLGVIGAPPTFNLWVEIRALISTVVHISARIKFLFWGIFLGGVYRLFLLSRPISFNNPFLYSSETPIRQIDLIHLINIVYSLVGLTILCSSTFF